MNPILKSYVEYGGANITHWSFLDREEPQIQVETLCAKAIVIIDKDGESKTSRKEALREKLKERLIVLQCREVENLLPYKVIKQVVIGYEDNPNLEIEDFTYDEYKNEYLGIFIEDQMFKDINFKRRGGYKADSGTLKKKVEFCERALPKIQYEDLPVTTQEIIKNIYQFIYDRNS